MEVPFNTEMKSSIGVVVVRSFVPVWIMINLGCPADSLSISSSKIALACSILGHLIIKQQQENRNFIHEPMTIVLKKGIA